MNESAEFSPQRPEGRSQAPAAALKAPVHPNLGAALRDDYDALQEDLRQANEVAASMEVQLAGKSKEVMHMKFLFEQTKAHLGHMQDSIVAMRMERHKIANEAMRAMGLDLMLARVTAERDRLKNELEGVLEGLAADNAEKPLRFDKRDHQIAELTFELINLKQELADLRKSNPPPAPVAPEPPPPSSPRPLKTAGKDDTWLEPAADEMEIIPTERVSGGRAKA